MKGLRMEFESVWVVDFGGQYNQLIARRVREANVYAEIVPFEKAMDRLAGGERPAGAIFTGGPSSVYEDGAPSLPKAFFEQGFPILGICYGAQLMAHTLGGKVVSPDFKEYGRVGVYRTDGAGSIAGAGGDASGCAGFVAGSDGAAECGAGSILFDGIGGELVCWMSHTDYIEKAPEGFHVTSQTDNCPTASMENHERKLYGVQFHPEVHHTPFGQKLLRNFLYKICGLRGEWTMANFAKRKVE
ncbi:MAG: gamma-glutamyl-gamma-aminobutyrate hydrolase family protein, partial [Clostridiales Family XIII bacterium]|nr:gamma-glutamyl-gamma-aminobutyrate hydrolase family protein [Clostridiales Family XIII bacterium]